MKPSLALEIIAELADAQQELILALMQIAKAESLDEAQKLAREAVVEATEEY